MMEWIDWTDIPTTCEDCLSNAPALLHHGVTSGERAELEDRLPRRYAERP